MPADRLSRPLRIGRAGTTPRHAYAPADDFYQLLIEAHRGLSDAQSELLNARLVLLLANQIGDLDLLAQVLAAARAGVAGAPDVGTEPTAE